MKKIIATAALALAAVALVAPAHADNDPNMSSPVNAADNSNFAASGGLVPDTLGQEVAKVPVLAPYIGNQKNNATNGNVLDHARP